MTGAMRSCTLCDVWYPAGTYAEHARYHTPKRASQAGNPKGATDPKRAAAIALAVADGVRTLEAIGADYGITRERVRQVAERAGMSRNHVPVPARPRLGPRTRCLTCSLLVPRGTMRAHRIAAGHTHRANARLTAPGTLELIREFYQRGLGYNAIGDALGVDHMTAKRAVSYLGLAPHRHGHYPRGGVIPRLRAELAARLREKVA